MTGACRRKLEWIIMVTDKKQLNEKEDFEPGTEENNGKGLVLDLDNIALNARELLRETIAEILKKAGVQKDDNIFARHCIDGAPEHCVPPLIESLQKNGVKLSENKIVPNIEEAFQEKIRQKVELNKSISELTAKARKNGFVCGALTALDEPCLQATIEKTGEGFFDAIQTCSSLARIGSYSANWRTLASKLELPPQQCVAVVSNDLMCKSALAAGMRCIVVPGKYTAWQDFAGADIVVDELADVNQALLESTLKPCSFRAAK